MQRDPEEKERLAITRILGKEAGDLLEVGCGDGRMTGWLRDLSSSILALDPEAGSLALAADRHPDGVRFLAGSGEALPVKGEKFDTVVFSLSLHHQEPSRALAEARRVIRGKGRILVIEPGVSSPFNRLFRIVKDEDEKYARAEKSVRECGLKIGDSGAYSSRWLFKDFAELAEDIFSYSESGPDGVRVKAMERVLGGKKDSRPLIVEDITNYWLLR